MKGVLCVLLITENPGCLYYRAFHTLEPICLIYFVLHFLHVSFKYFHRYDPMFKKYQPPGPKVLGKLCLYCNLLDRLKFSTKKRPGLLFSAS